MCCLKENKFFVLTVFIVIFNFYFSWALPKKPTHPENESSFSIINNYYGLENGLPLYSQVSTNDVQKGQFVYRKVKLKIENVILKDNPELQLLLKIPINSLHQAMPVIALFTGFQTGEQSVDLIEDQGENILMSIQYPMPLQQNHNYQWNWDWTAFESIPLLMTISLHWLQGQNNVDINRINILSVSFGSIFTPLTLRWLNHFGIRVRTVTLGYGGGDIPLVVGQELRKYLGSTETDIAKILLSHQTWVYEPKFHSPHIKGDFLIVHGQEDQVFPAESIAVFDQINSAEKVIINLPGPHIQPDRKDLILKFTETVKDFLITKHAIN